MSEEKQEVRTLSKRAQDILDAGQVTQKTLLTEINSVNGPIELARVIGTVLAYSIGFQAAVAAELAEMNSRDSAAEVRARDAEAFVAGIQQELARSQGVIAVPGAVVTRGR